MKTDNNKSNATNLRQKAEEKIKTKQLKSKATLSETETLKLIHELEVHQVELEMQNDELLRAKEQIEETTGKYTDLYDFAPSGYFTLSNEGEIIGLNLSAAKMLGKERLHLLNRRFALFVSDDTKANFHLFIEEVYNNNTKETCEVKLDIEGKIPTYLHIEGIVDKSKGKLFITAVDITGRKQNENALQQSNQKLEAIISASPDGIGIVSFDGKIQLISDKLIAMYGYKIEERESMIGRSMFDFIDPSNRKILKDNLGKLLSGKSEHKITEYMAIKKDHSRFYIEVNANFLSDANGKPTSILFIERDITEHKQAEEELRKSEEKYRMFIDDASEAFFQGDAQGNLILVNQAACELTAYNEDELLKINLKDLFLEEDIAQTPLRYDLLEQGKTIKTERRIKRKDGTIVFIEMNSKQLPDGTYQSFIININERKEAEIALQFSEKKYKLITDKIYDVVWLMNLQGKSLFVSPSIEGFTGFTVEEYIAQSIEERFTPESATIGLEILKKEVFLYAQAELPKNYTKTMVLDYLCKDGSVKTGELLITPYFDENHSLIGIHGVTRNITERKKAEEALKESNNKINLLVNNLRGVAYRCINDRDWTMEYISNGIFELTGYSSNDFINNRIRSYNSIILEEDRQAVYNEIQKSIKHKNTYTIEYRITTQDKQQKWVWERGRGVYEKENVVAIEGFISDITERKQAENEKNKLLTIIENSSNEIYVFDANTYQFKYVNQGAINNIGYSLSEIKKLTPIAIKTEYTISSFDKMLQPLKAGTTKMISFETTLRRKNGTIYPVEVNIHLSKQEDEEVFLSVINDITEKKKFEEEIVKNEQRYTDLVNNMSEGVYQSTTDGRFLNVNPAMVKMFGYQSVKEMLAIDIKKELYFKPEDRGNTYPEAGNDKHSELLLKKKDGSPIWVADSGWYIKNEQGEVIRHEGILHDITEQKLAENKLIENNSRLELAMKTANMAWWEMDIATGNVIFEKRKAEMLGYAPEKFKHYKDFTKLLHPDDYPKAMDAMRKHIEGKVDKYEIEYRILTKSGEYKWFYDIGSIVKRDLNGKPLKITGLVIDISERKQVEEKLKIAHDQLRRFIDSNIVGVIIASPNGKIAEANDYYLNLIGYTREELETNKVDWRSITPTEWLHTDENAINELRKTGTSNPYEKEYLRRDGTRVAVLIVDAMLPGPEEQIAGFILDITKRKEMEETLRSSQQLIEGIINTIPVRVFWKDKNLHFLGCNEIFASDAGYTNPKDIIGKDDFEMIWHKQAELYRHDDRQVIESGCSKLLTEEQQTTPEGKTITLLTSKIPLRNFNGDIIGVLGTYIDISIRKQEEALMAQHNQILSKLNQFAIEMTMLSSEDNLEIFITKKIKEISGAELATFAEYNNENKTINVRHIELEPSILKKILSLFQIQMSKISATVSDKMYQEMTTQTIGMRKTLHEATLGAIPNTVSNTLQALLKADRIIAIAYLIEGKLFGTSLLAMRKSQPDPPKELLENFINMAAISLRRKQAELELRKRETLLQKIFDLLPIGLWFADKTGKLISGNPAGIKIWGAEPTVGIEKYGIFKARHFPSGKEIEPEDWALAHTIKEGITTTDELLEIDAFDGKKKIILNYTAPILGEDGSIEGAIIVNNEITEQKIAENKIQAISKEWQETFNSVNDAIWIMGIDGKINRCNKASEKLLGIKEADLQGRFCWEVMHHTHEPIKECPVLCLKESRKREIFEMSELNRWIEVTVDPIFDEKGELTGIVHLMTDITERKQAEELLRESEERFKVLHNASFGGIAIHDNGIILECNQGLSEMTGYSQDELIGMDGLLLLAVNSQEYVRNKMATKFEKPYEAFGMRKNGEIFPMRLEARSVPFKGKRVRTVEFRDITEQKKAEAEILMLNESLEERVIIRTAQLEASYNEMEAFTYSVSHDLRAPLRAIDGFAKMLLQDFSDLDPEALRLLNVISQSSSNMSKLIEDLLAFSRVGRANIDVIPIKMKDLVQSIVAQIKRETNNKKTMINILELPDAPGDKTLLGQVWTNLIRNAIKFSLKKEKPIVEIGSYIEENKAVFYVKDNGVGFDMKYVDKLFGVFQRLHSTDEFEGTGIGLAIVKKAIGRHGGRVWAESIEGKGATFYFTLPVG